MLIIISLFLWLKQYDIIGFFSSAAQADQSIGNLFININRTFYKTRKKNWKGSN